ncbi:MAG: hypothetical protein ABI721_00790 [Candidatus Dojkabacteria bacterium]
MKKLKENLKKLWERIKKRRLLLLGLFIALLVVINTLFYIIPSTNNQNNGINGAGRGQTVNGDNYSPDKNTYESDSTQLVDNLPYDSIEFSIALLRPDEDGTNIISVGLKDDSSRQLFDQWLVQYKYSGGTRFVFYTKPPKN